MTTQLLEEAFAKASNLPIREQDVLARFVMEEIESENKWNDSFTGSQDVLAQLADAALAEHKKGETYFPFSTFHSPL